ncbi:MAG: S41 family peptidase [Candidatus Cloacimonas sp.]|nr:DNA primase [Candidatus Cloacimonadota bacterium]
MRNLVTAILLFGIVLLNAVEPKFMKDPAISPDGKTVCFTYMTDLWLVPFEGGEAKRITVSDGVDRDPIYSPDGKWIAFTSNREGFYGVYLIPSEGGQAKLLSRDISTASDWFSDSKRILGTRYENGTGTGSYIAYLDGKRPTEISPIGHHFSTLSPDNKKIIFNRNGMPERPAYKGSMKGDLWEYDIKSKRFKKLTDTELTERYPIFSYVNPYIYYSSSDGNLFQLYRAKNYDFENQEQLTFFTDWAVRDLSIARQNDRIVFEKFDEIWRYNPDTGKSEKIEVVIKQDYLGNYDVTENIKNRAKLLTVSEDGKLAVFSYKYDLFAIPEKGGEVKQLTFDKKGIGNITILPDSQTIYFTKRDQGYYQLFSLNIKEPEKISKVKWFEGKYILRFYKTEGERIIVHYEEGESRRNAAFFDPKTEKVEEFKPGIDVWSNYIAVTKDQRYAFYVTGRPKVWTTHLYLYDFEKKTNTLLLNAYGYIGNLQLGKDGKSLFMTYGSDVARLDFQPIADYVNEKDNWDEILGETNDEQTKDKKDEKKKDEELNILVEGIKDRLTVISKHSGFSYPVYAPNDSTLYYMNREGSKYSFRKIDYYGKKDEEMIGFSGDLYSWSFNIPMNTVYLTLDDTPYKASLAGRKLELLPNSFEYEYNTIELNKTVFDELWVEFGRFFYDYKMHGKDWNEMYRRYYPYLDYSYITEYFSYVVDEMIGELNASHTGFYPRQRNRSFKPIAYPGIVLDYGRSAKQGIYVKKVYRTSTLAATYGIKEGDLLLKVDDVEIDEYTSIEPLFTNKVDKKIKMTFKTKQELKEVEIKGLTFYEHYMLYYKDWIEGRRDLVTKLSNGRLGYLHINRMDQESLQKFEEDLFAENFDKEGIVIDVRFNGGGNISSELLDILTRKQRAYTTTRGYPDEMFATPATIWQKPTTLLINESSFSDAEIFPILFKQLGIGKVIGVPTSGGVIGTTPYELMDGSSMRLPRSGWYTLEGVNMEGTGASPDIFVDLTPEQLIKDDDQQIIKAVEVLLEEVDKKE